MMNTFKFTELKSVESPLVELSKKYETLPDRELNKSLGERPMGMIPRRGGEWSGEPGNSEWRPERDFTPSDRNYSNPDGRTWEEILDKYGIDGVSFEEGEPDFSEVSRGTVEIDNFSDARYGAGGNFDQADEKLAEAQGCTKEEVRQWRNDNNYTWHERSDCRTMEKVPREVHGNIAHRGGISKMRSQLYGR